MAIIKCKMCGGELDFNPGDSVGVCVYCGTRQTLPHLNDERRSSLYDRANHFRRNKEFDKAEGIYEQILNEDTTDAEAYWSLVLCRYGIEYVEDPAKCKRVPTVNRTQFTSVFDDDNYISAIKYADSDQRAIYEAEAREINEFQKGILAISQKEEPFDVFICYKETDADGLRTQDSVLATDLYYQLTNENFKVFFSRITLEDKLGSEYEPYIFAALNSAKVMVVLGTKAEHFNAVWVKNEWSRYLSIVKQSDGKKVLIPAYRDMDPYDLPDEFSHLQAQDMSKLGFMQDLIRGIKKIVKADEPKAVMKETIVAGTGNANIEPLLKRAFFFLEDGKWTEADNYCEKVLDQDPENAQAYLGKLMAELRVCRQEDLFDCMQPFNNSNNYQKAVRFGSDELLEMLSGAIAHINERNENMRITGIYNNAVSTMNKANSESAFKAAAAAFKSIPGFKDANLLAGQCLEKAEVCRKDMIYQSAKSLMTGFTISRYESAIRSFSTIPGWRDADEQIDICRKKIEEMRIAWKKKAKKRKRKIATVLLIIIAGVVFKILLTTVIIPKQRLNKAMRLLNTGDGEAASVLINELEDKDIKRIKSSDSWRKICPVGETIFFGTDEAKEDIEWLVLAKEDDRMLVVSEYALSYQQYNTSLTDTTWENCSLRTWLNETFLNTAFSDKERALIPAVEVSADKNPEYPTTPGNTTTDHVFLLSVTEVNEYFSSNSARQCGTYGWWWLRSPGESSDSAALVYPDGSVAYIGDPVNYDGYMVRPALWINLNS